MLSIDLRSIVASLEEETTSYKKKKKIPPSVTNKNL
jgi:hypothetical protein